MLHSRILTAVAVAALIPGTSFSQSREERVAGKHGWRFDYEQAVKDARQKNKPLMVVFRCIP